MKKIALLLNYFTFSVLLLSLLFESCAAIQSIKYVLLIVAGLMLFRITTIYRGNTGYHTYNLFFLAILGIFIIFSLMAKTIFFPNIVVELLAAAIVGFIISLTYTQPKRPVKRCKKAPKIIAPQKPKARKVKKTTTKKSTKKRANSVAKKKVAKKTAKKSTRKATKKTAKKVAKKTATKKAKKTTKKKATKKQSSKTAARKSGFQKAN